MVTCSNIGFGNQLGAQMTNLADLYYIARENNQKLVLFDEFKSFRRGYQFLDVFDLVDIEIIRRYKGKLWTSYCNQFKKSNSWESNFKRIYADKLRSKLDALYYKLTSAIWYSDFEHRYSYKDHVVCNPNLLELDENKNYDICSGFGTYREWGKYECEIKKLFSFKKDIVEEAGRIWNELNLSEKKTCSIHFRRTDYLLISSLNLSDDYYTKAISCFDKDATCFVVFSDDIEACKNMPMLQGLDVVYMEQHKAAVDMCLMSKCDSNIIANSTFSFWGAFLGNGLNRKVVCPYNFIGESAPESTYINGNYYPESWIALEEN